MGLFDGIFGGFFDFNHDGKTDLSEEFLGYMMINELMKEEAEEEESDFDFDDCFDEDDDL